MSDEKITIHIDSAEQDPDIPQIDRCPDHHTLQPEIGYIERWGFAGVGCGIYSYCGECGRMLSKTQDHE